MMRSENKQKICSQLLKKVNWRAFVLESDGPKKRSVAEKRDKLVQKLALYADPDGSNVKASVVTMAAELGYARQTVYDLLASLKQMDCLSEGDLVWVYAKQVRVRALKIENILKRAGLPIPVQNSSEALVSKIGEVPCVQNRYQTQPALNPKPLTHTQPAQARGASEKNTFHHVARYLHEDMLASQWKKDEKARADALIAEYGFEKFLAAEKLYWQTQDPNSRTIFRWTAFLDGFQGWLAKITPAQLEGMANERWRKDNPDEYERQQQASIDRQIQEHAHRELEARRERERQAELRHESEVDPSELFEAADLEITQPDSLLTRMMNKAGK